MIPDFKEFKKYAKKYDFIPVSANLIADTITPVSALSILEKDGSCFLLESISGGNKVFQYSFLGCGKANVFKCEDGQVTITEGGRKNKYATKDPLGELNKYTIKRKCPDLEELPEFQGGGVGFISYDMFRTVEYLPNCPIDDLGIPDILFSFHEYLLVFDHAKRCLKIIVYADITNDSMKVGYEKAISKIDKMIRKLKKIQPLPLVNAISLGSKLKLKYKSNTTKKKYMQSVKDIIEHIKKGDIFQCVLSQRLETDLVSKPINIYRALRAINPSPYMFYLKYKDLMLVGSSPEILVSVDKQKRTTVRPIAGTRPRGKNIAEDEKLAKELLNDHKEVAEHTMLVDLARNDLGRSSEYKSITIDERLIVEYYSHVMHIVSTVSGKLKKGLNSMDAFKACFPAGTLSGAPKIRAMQILDELETTKRGPFGGGVGYIDYQGHMDTCITIRTILIKGKKAYVQAGAGIVADSVPEKEFEETLNKARALLKAIEIASKNF
ncbi:MAG: anthranilate synthase component I [Planctomycetota bacterium]|nr:MAG: anthranilate synthase component I [Planctomycetota bacterium]